MQERDPLSAFLHSDAWITHTGGQQDSAGNCVTQHPLPLKGIYWRSTRCFIDDAWKIPEFALNGWFLRLQPDSAASAQHLASYCARVGLHTETGPVVQPQQTLVVDLTQSQEDLLTQMHQKHRYNIRVAEKNGVMVQILRDELKEALPRFFALLTSTTERHGFRSHAQAHYQSIIEKLAPAGMVKLAFAQHQERDVAAALLINYNGVTTYLHGGSSYEDRALMAPNLLHWEIMKQAKAEGATRYDFWGVKTQGGQAIPNHPSYGTTRFKLGFGGELVDYPPTTDVVLNRFCYTLYRGVNRLRSRNRAFS